MTMWRKIGLVLLLFGGSVLISSLKRTIEPFEFKRTGRREAIRRCKSLFTVDAESSEKGIQVEGLVDEKQKSKIDAAISECILKVREEHQMETPRGEGSARYSRTRRETDGDDSTSASNNAQDTPTTLDVDALTEIFNKGDFETCDPIAYEDTKNTSLMNDTSLVNDTNLMNDKRTIWLAVVIPMFDKNLMINPRTGMTTFMTLQFAVDLINLYFPEGLSGYKIRLKRVFPTTAIDVDKPSLQYVSNCINTGITAVFGPTYNVNLDRMSSLTSIRQKTHIAQASTSSAHDADIWMREEELGVTIKTAFQTNPGSIFQLMAARDTVLRFGWNYVFWIETESMFESIIQHDKICVQGKFIIPLPADRFHDNYNVVRDTILDIRKLYPKLRVLILATTVGDSRHVLRAVKELGFNEHFILFFIGKGVNNIEVVKGYEDIAMGSISIEPANYAPTVEEAEELSDELLRFERWFRDSTPDKHRNLFFHLYWEQVFGCRLESDILAKYMPQRVNYTKLCTGEERFEIGKGIHLDEGAFRGIMLGLKTLAYTFPIIRDYVPLDCSRHPPIGWIDDDIGYECYECIWDHPRCVNNFFRGAIAQLNTINRQILYPEASYKLDAGKPVPNASFAITNFKFLNGRYQAVPIGNWTIAYYAKAWEHVLPEITIVKKTPELKLDSHLVFWRSSAHGIVEAGKCSKDCDLGWIRQYATLRCCWNCAECPTNNIVISNKCRACSQFEKADIENSRCLPLPVYGLIDYTKGLVIGVFALVGLVITLLISIVMLRNNHKHMVRASGRDLSYFMLIGNIMLFISTGLFLMSPTKRLCMAREMVPSMALMISFSSFCLKNLRLYRIFEVYKAKMTSPSMISPRSQICLVLGFIALQISIFFFSDTRNVYLLRSLSSNGRAVLTHCNQGDSAVRFLLHNVISILSMIVCTYLSYRLRDLPKSYNETKHYSFAAFSIVITLLLFFPLYVIIKKSDNYFHDVALCVLYTLIGTIILCCVYMPRIWKVWKGKEEIPGHFSGSFQRSRTASGTSYQRNRTPSGSSSGRIRTLSDEHRRESGRIRVPSDESGRELTTFA